MAGVPAFVIIFLALVQNTQSAPVKNFKVSLRKALQPDSIAANSTNASSKNTSVTSDASRKSSPVSKDLMHLNASNKMSLNLPNFLAHMAEDCDCHFVGMCSCETTLRFMDCITTACSSGKCACHANDNPAAHHYWACTNMSAVCPSVALQCNADGTHSCGEAAASIDEEATGTITQEPVPAEPAAKEKTWKEWFYENNFMARIVAFFIQFIPFLIAALIYDCFRKRKGLFSQTPLPENPPGKLASSFGYGLFSCFADWKISLLACCCCAIRWADTMDKAQPRLLGYWLAVFIIILLNALSPLLAGFTTLIVLAVCTFMRQKLREELKIKFGGLSIFEDCCIYMWCSCCAVVQEARQVEQLPKAPPG